MLREIGRRFDIDLAGVPCVGDSLRDLQAAEAVGAQPMLVLTGKGEKTLRDGNFPKNTVIFPDLAFAASALLAQRLSDAGPMSAVARARCSSLFQLIVTPLYAVVMLLLFWLPRVPTLPDRRALVPRQPRGARAGSAASARASIGAREHPAGPTSPHVVMSKHSSTWETLALTHFFPPLAFVAKKELLSIPFFGWGFALASPITIDRKAGIDAMQQIVDAGPRALRAGLLDRRLPGRHADPRRHARQVQDRRRAPRHRARRADPAGRAQRRLPVAQGRLRQAAGHDHDFVRPADRPRTARTRRR